MLFIINKSPQKKITKKKAEEIGERLYRSKSNKGRSRERSMKNRNIISKNKEEKE